MRNTLVRIDGKLDTGGEKISEIEDILSIIQNQTQRKKSKKKTKKILAVIRKPNKHVTNSREKARKK